MTLEPSANRARAGSGLAASRLMWVDLIKAVAMIWIFLNHLSEQLLGSPYIANPSPDWPPLAERLAQLRPLEGYGLWNVPLNLLRYVGWSGDQGVQLFLIAGGFGLTWGLLRRQANAPLPLGDFYYARAVRIYPLWWGAHFAFLGTSLIIGRGLQLSDPAFYLSLAGIRVTPGLLYYFAPAWWYIGLLIQLYAIYPLLWEGLRRYGPLRFVVISSAAAFIVRGAGLLLLTQEVDAWSRGAIFITRLPEFAFGMTLAAWLSRAPEQTDECLRAASMLLLGFGCYVLGTGLSLSLLGMTVAPFLLGVGAFLLLYAALAHISEPATREVRPWVWVGRHSYALFLVHQPLITNLVPHRAAGADLRAAVLGSAAAVLLTLVGAVALERVVGTIRAAWSRPRLLAAAAAAAALLIGAELVTRAVDPQEVRGWGERPSLEPHPRFGWRLRPSQQTHLRWESYDYYVTANSLGFPGPEYPPERAPGGVRILTIGDAFTSAEGVDTIRAWPRLLEADLAARLADRRIEVLNFGITGYGPNQYVAVLEQFVPVYRPDVIVVGFFVNDFDDVLISNAEFQGGIGFRESSPEDWHAFVTLLHFRRLVRLRLLEPLYEFARGKPAPHRYFLGQFAALERDGSRLPAGRDLVAERLARVKEIADAVGTRVMIAMIPAPVQVCGPDALAYYPRNVDLTDTTQFDVDRPQRMTEEIAATLGFGYYDLRPVLRAAPGGCPYQPRNLHWTAAGHRVVADYLANVLLADSYLLAEKDQDRVGSAQ